MCENMEMDGEKAVGIFATQFLFHAMLASSGMKIFVSGFASDRSHNVCS